MPKKIKDPAKKATDPVLLSHLGKAGIDKDYVEFTEDYNAAHPMAKFYRDRLSGKRFQVISGLPMARSDDGSRIQPRFESSINKWHFGNNNFEGEVLKTGGISLAPVIDTFSGVLAGRYVHWNPKLYVGGIEITPVSGPVLLAIDPINSNYSNNVLEWDYGYCKRWLRVIEGRFMERWVFQQSPGAEVSIVHNCTGEKGIFRLGPYAVDDDVEFVPLAVFQLAEYPFIISTTSTFYPTDGSYEDGIAYHIQDNTAWSTLVGAAGTGSNYSQTLQKIGFLSGTASDWKELYRLILIMLTSSIPDDDVISASTLSLYNEGSKDDQNSAAPVTNIYSAAPANDHQIAAGDYDSLGTTAFCDAGVTYANWSSGYNDLPFNATGIGAISKTGPTRLGARFECDAEDSEPTRGGNSKVSRVYFYTVEQGAGYKPKLVVTHAPPNIEESISVTVEAKVSVQKQLTMPISVSVEPRVEVNKHLIMPVSVLAKAEIEGDLIIGLYRAISVLAEAKIGVGKTLITPISAMAEAGIEGTFQAGLFRSISAMVAAGIEAGQTFIFPIEVLAEAGAAVNFNYQAAISALVETEISITTHLILFSKSDVLINIWNEEKQVN